MTTPTPAQTDEKARDEVLRLIREEFDPTPPGDRWSSVDWNDNAEEVADKIIAALRPEGEAVAEAVARKAGWYPAIGEPGKITRSDMRCQGGVSVDSWEEACAYDRLPYATPPAPAQAKPDPVAPAVVKELSAIEKSILEIARADDPSYFTLLTPEQGKALIANARAFLAERGIRASLLPPSTEAQAGSPAEALPSQTSGADQDRYREAVDRVNRATDTEIGGIHRSFAPALAKPTSEPAGGGVLREVAECLESLAGRVAAAGGELDPTGPAQDLAWARRLLPKLTALPSPASSSPAEAEALPAGVQNTESAWPARQEEALPGVERIVEAMEDDPFWQDASLAGTTQQDQRIRHYAEVAVRALSPAQAGAAPAGEER